MRNFFFITGFMFAVLLASNPSAAADSVADSTTKEQIVMRKDGASDAAKSVKISGGVQERYRQDKSIKSAFDMRRARLDLKGEATRKIEYDLLAELAGASGKLLEATIVYKPIPSMKLTFGQFKIPFSQENMIPDFNSATVNRSQVVEALVARGKDVIGNQIGRDIGVQASESLGRRKDFYVFDYAIGIFNGSGINTMDTNDDKDIIGRLAFHPLKSWSVGGSMYSGKYTLSSAPAKRNTRNRIGADVAFQPGIVSFRGEYIKGKDGIIVRDGWYVEGTYFVIPKLCQAAVKFDTYDPNRNVKKDEADVCTLGINLYFNPRAYVQFDYEIKNGPGQYNALTGQLTVRF